jgi:hypothetical protein
VKPAARRQAIGHLIGGNFLSERQACQLIGMSRSAFRYQAIERGDAAMREIFHAELSRLNRFAPVHLTSIPAVSKKRLFQHSAKLGALPNAPARY